MDPVTDNLHSVGFGWESIICICGIVSLWSYLPLVSTPTHPFNSTTWQKISRAALRLMRSPLPPQFLLLFMFLVVLISHARACVHMVGEYSPLVIDKQLES